MGEDSNGDKLLISKIDGMESEVKDLNNTVGEFIKLLIKLETVLIGVQDAPGLCGKVKSQGKEIDRLSKWRWQVVGAVTGIVAIAGCILKYSK